MNLEKKYVYDVIFNRIISLREHIIINQEL